MKPQYNLTTNAPYRGKNQAKLLEVKEEMGYKSDGWATYVQVQEMDKKLLNARGKGVFLRTFTEERVKNEKGKVERLNRPVGFVVFNEDHMRRTK